MTPVRIVYLDIDGVLKPARRHDGGSALSPANVACLNALADVPSLRIVVSSTWRRDSACRDRLVAAGVAIPFLDASWRTPDDDDDDRQDQVLRHLRQGWRTSHDVVGFAAIDDMFGPTCDWLAAHVVATDPDAGLDATSLDALRKALKRTPPPIA